MKTTYTTLILLLLAFSSLAEIDKEAIAVEVIVADTIDIEILGSTSICAGSPAELIAIPDTLDYYIWSNGCEGVSPQCDVYNDGWVSVTAYYGECSGTDSVFIDLTGIEPLFVSYDPLPPYCEGDTVCVSLDADSVLWSCFDEDNPDYDCNIYSDTLNQTMFYCGPGTYSAEYFTNNGCGSISIFYIPTTDSPSFDFNGEEVICDTTQIILLSGEDPIGGYFSGNGVSGNTFDPAIAGVGIHEICYTYSDSECDSISCIEIEVETCSGIDEHSSSPFTVFPNPSSGYFTLQSSFNSGEIFVFDAVGKMVFTESLKSNIVINAESWTAGIYFLHIHTPEGIFREKIEIINR